MTEALDVRRLPYMPLYLERLQRSKAWLRCKRRPELAFFLVNLWMRAFREVPAGSIEDDDDILADAAMCDPATWERVRDDVLRGWIRENGRLFHHVVTEVAAEAATKLRGNKAQTEAAREALRQARAREQGSFELCEPSVTDTVTGHEVELEVEAEREDTNPAQRSTTSPELRCAVPLEMRLREAAGLVEANARGLRQTGVIEQLIAQGVSLEGVILPTLRDAAVAKRSVSSWAYFVPAIRERLSSAVSTAGAAPQVVLSAVWVTEGSPQGDAWEAHSRRTGADPVKWVNSQRNGTGRSLPSEWPPDHPRHTADQPAGAAA